MKIYFFFVSIGYKNKQFINIIPDRVSFNYFFYLCTQKGIQMLSSFLKEKRKLLNLTQNELAQKAGVGLRVLREMEQGKLTLRMDKVNQVLMLFGAELGVVPKSRDHE